MKRVCKRCGAPTWSPHSPYCRHHRPSFEQRQLWPAKDRASRGYGSVHKATRERYAALVASGLAVCARCGLSIEPGAPWDLGHTEDRTGYSGPEHQEVQPARGSEEGRGGVARPPRLSLRLSAAGPRTGTRPIPRRPTYRPWGRLERATHVPNGHLKNVAPVVRKRLNPSFG